MSQKSDILAALQNGEALTRRQISQRFDCDKAPARIAELRQEGWPIVTETLSWTTEQDVHKSCARWSLCVAGQLSLEV